MDDYEGFGGVDSDTHSCEGNANLAGMGDGSGATVQTPVDKSGQFRLRSLVRAIRARIHFGQTGDKL